MIEDEEWETCPDNIDNYVVLDVDGFSADAIQKAAKLNHGIAIMGLETESPFMRIGTMFFKGVFDNSIGSDIIFATSDSSSSQSQRAAQKNLAPAPPRYGLANAMLNRLNAANDKKANLTLMGTTETHIRFTRVRLEKRVVPVLNQPKTGANDSVKKNVDVDDSDSNEVVESLQG
ncbi:hypothetical protein HK100_002241 [Physocladia obscura]|uniref:Transcription factor TFIIIC triple barrel domain-containing protein n=1 Tax=Physocladia obscura TaxID=109957 RepID=A0AAD5SYT1_9FUNG|nr:hypothetical protein HK100_002241 [Physocladia obscura]